MSIRYVSQLFQPMLTIPKNAIIKNTEITCKSQKLLLECGLIRPSSPGFFTLLPLAKRSLDKLEKLLCTLIEDVGAQKLSLPTLTESKLWEKTGRLQEVGAELMKIQDRHNKKFLLAPTYEEAVADLLADVGPLSYKQLPLILYQISNKYRDEVRAKHGLLRAREFAMLDAYSAHAHAACARNTYEMLACVYRALFSKLELPVHRVEAPTGEMGGSISHEWQLQAPSGEDAIDICASCSHSRLASEDRKCGTCGKEMERVNSIEVGHTFVLGTKYSDALHANYIPATGEPQSLIMACYGIGLSRLLAASVEALSSETALQWPEAIAPYKAIIIGPKEGSKEWDANGFDKAHEAYFRVREPGPEPDVLIDDRHHLTVGRRLLMAQRTGYPYIIIAGRSTLSTPPRFELLSRSGAATLLADELPRALTRRAEDELEPMEEEDY